MALPVTVGPPTVPVEDRTDEGRPPQKSIRDGNKLLIQVTIEIQATPTVV